MAELLNTFARRKYSWWWDSHISPKNSKWLQENLTDMDVKVKSMIKLIEEDADSFARRAEMYYKKRPELMKLVEEFYRAYRALAERYDHATGVIRHAQHTMSEAFPNQLPFMFEDDHPTGPNGANTKTLNIWTQIGEYTDEPDSHTKRKTLQQFNDHVRSVEHTRRALNFYETEEKEPSNGISRVKDKEPSKTDIEKNSTEILALKEALATLESEKKSGFAQYQQSLHKISQLEAEISKTCEDLRLLTDHAKEADNEVSILKEKITSLEAEKESKLQEYHESIEKLNERASSAEIEAQSLKGEHDKLASEKNSALDRYLQSLETISSLENKLRFAEENATGYKERAEKAESKIETLRQTISKLTEEKEAVGEQYKQCLDLISSLEEKLATTNEEAKRLNVEVEDGVSKLKGAEEQHLLLERSNQSLHTEIESLMLKFGTQTQELTNKQKELGRLWTCVQEERLRFVEAETALQTLQHLHTQTQEELRAMASELQNRAQLLTVSESQNRDLQDEVLKIKEENKQLDELNAASVLSTNIMKNVISSLVESKGKLEEEVELRHHQTNALQQEIYCLKEDLEDLNGKHISVLDQVHAVGLNPISLGRSVKELQDENSSLKETCHRESDEKASLLEKLAAFEQLLAKNSLLEASLSDMNTELEAVRGKIEELEKICQLLFEEKSILLEEKSALASRLQETDKNMNVLSNNNAVLENFLSNVHLQLEAFKATLKALEDSYHLLVDEKACLISEKDELASHLENTRTELDHLRKLYAELDGRIINLVKEKESTLRKVDELNISLDIGRQENVSYIQMTETQLNEFAAKMLILQEDCRQRKTELDKVLDNVVCYEIEIFVLRETARLLKEINCSSFIKNQKLLKESNFLEKKISLLDRKNIEQEYEIRSLMDQASSLRMGHHQLLGALDIVENCAFEDKAEHDQFYVRQLFDKLQTLKKRLSKADKENLCSSVEMSVFVAWIRQLTLDLKNLEAVVNKIEHEKEALLTQVEDLNVILVGMQREKTETELEKRSLIDNIQHLEGANNVLVEENNVLHSNVLALENLSFIFKIFTSEKSVVFREIGVDCNKLRYANADLIRKLRSTEQQLEELKDENLKLKERLHKTEVEIEFAATDRDLLRVEIENGKKLMNEMALQLQEAEEKIRLVEKQKLELNKNVDSLKMDYNEVNTARVHQENQILKLSADNELLGSANNVLTEATQKLENDLCKLHDDHELKKVHEEKLSAELQNRTDEIEELEIQAADVFGQLQSSMVTQLIYEQKFRELNNVCRVYMDQNEGLNTQLAACGPEILLLKECISSLENQTDVHIKFPNTENEDLQASNNSGCAADLRNLTARLQAITKAASELKDLMLQENTALQSKLLDTTKQLESLQSDNGPHHHNRRVPTSEIIEAYAALLTKDIVLDQVSDSSSYNPSKRQTFDPDNQTVEPWETSDPVAGLTGSKSKKITESIEFHRVKSIKKQKSMFLPPDQLDDSELVFDPDKLEISKRSNESFTDGKDKRRVLERLDSDVQKLANLQITVQDLKRKLESTEKGKRGKAAVECESLRVQLDVADSAVMNLFELNGRLMKSIDDDQPFSSENKSSGTRRRRMSEQARRMSEKIGRLQMEVQRLQFVLMKMDDVKDAKNRVSWEGKRRILLKDFLYGRTGPRRKKAQFCSCVQASAVDE